MDIKIPDPKFKVGDIIWLQEYNMKLIKTRVQTVGTILTLLTDRNSTTTQNYRHQYSAMAEERTLEYIEESNVFSTKEELIESILAKTAVVDKTGE